MKYAGYDIEVIRSSRKTVGLQVKPDGSIIIRSPRFVSERELRSFIDEKRSWLDRAVKKVTAGAEAAVKDPISPEEIRMLADRAVAYIPSRAAHYASIMGVDYGRITVRNQTTIWGSCTAKGNLNFNCLLMLAPPEVIDSVVVHELAHRKVMNHSLAFYETVRKAFPDYDRWNGWLKRNGPALIARMRAGEKNDGA